MQPTKIKQSSEYIVFTYTNRYLEDINLTGICNSTDIRALYPLRPTSKLTVSYRYTPTIRSKVLNYGTTLLRDNKYPSTCDCQDSKFKDSKLGHIATGDLSIIPNKVLRNLVCKGVNFRECQKYTTKSVLESINKDIDDHILKLSTKKSLPVTMFSLWKASVLQKVSQQLQTLKLKRFPKARLKSRVVKEALKELHQKYVFVPTDKAQNNISVVCKKYYLETLKEELDSKSYTKCTQTEEQITTQHISDLKKLNITVEEYQQKLPFIYWTPKQHKDPTGSRFIVSGKSCSTKSLSKKLSFIFKLIMKTLRTHCNYKSKFLNTSLYWIINNSKPVHDTLRKINNLNKAKSISTFDFSKLYTNIPHDLLLDEIKFVVREAFSIQKDMKAIRVPKLKPTGHALLTGLILGLRHYIWGKMIL